MVTQDASSKFLGFLYQIERAMYRIFASEHNSAIFGIETADDVVEEISLENNHFHVSFEQDKHTLNNNKQPYQDSSKNLWHTLHIWLSTMKDAREKYEEISYCLVTNKKVGENTLANLLSEAKTDEQIKSAVEKLKKCANDISGTVKKTAALVVGYPEDELNFLIKNIILLDCHGTISGLETKPATINLFHLPPDIIEHAEKIYYSLLGLMVDKCKSAWKAREPARLTKEPFFNLLYTEITNLKRKKFIDQPIFKTSFKHYLEKDKSNHVFIEQLQYIGKNNLACNNALENYWAFYAERIRLQESGEIPMSAWEDRSIELFRRWLNIKLNTQEPDDTYQNKLTHFQDIFSTTMNPDYCAPLNSNDTSNSYFTIGNYHDLANHPEKEFFIYWHDDYNKKKEK